MKKRLFSSMAVVFLMLFVSAGSAFAAPQDIGVYFGVSGGYVIPQTMSVYDPDSSYKYMDTTLNNGFLIGVKSGWNTPFTRRIMAMEMEYNYISNDFDNSKIIPSPDHSGAPATLEGTISIHALLFNLKARYPEGRIHPYVGGGLGYAHFIAGDITERAVLVSDSEKWAGESGGAFCWQILVGVDFDIAPNISLGFGYKYFATKPTVGSIDKDIYADFDYKASILTMGLTFTF